MISITNRISKLRREIALRHFDAVLVSSILNITYLTNFSHFSKDEREAFLLIINDKQYILTDGRYSETVRNKIEDFELIEISPKFTFEKAFKTLAKKHKIKRVGFDHHNLTVAEYKKISRCFDDLNHFSIDKLRMIKDISEISAIQKACALSDKTFQHVLTRINAGVSEKELAFEIEFFIKKHGADIAFPPIVAFGKNSAIPHHQTSNQQLATSNQFVLLDFGVKFNNYCSDMTRTIFFGKASREQKRMYQIVLEAQKRAMEALTSDGGPERSRRKSSEVESIGIRAEKIDKIARDYITSHCYPTIPHSLGHGIGLEVHESPRLSPKSKDKLNIGMVFTIEPGIYIPGFGGVRIEDVVVLEKSVPRMLTKSERETISI